MRNFVKRRPAEVLAPPGLIAAAAHQEPRRRRATAWPLYLLGRQLEPHLMARELLLQEAAPPPPPPGSLIAVIDAPF